MEFEGVEWNWIPNFYLSNPITVIVGNNSNRVR